MNNLLQNGAIMQTLFAVQMIMMMLRLPLLQRLLVDMHMHSPLQPKLQAIIMYGTQLLQHCNSARQPPGAQELHHVETK